MRQRRFFGFIYIAFLPKKLEAFSSDVVYLVLVLVLEPQYLVACLILTLIMQMSSAHSWMDVISLIKSALAEEVTDVDQRQ